MDNGARFHRCDFQIHTPRDPNWKGKRPENETEREVWADSFVTACRKAGLDAVAITDHHDTTMFPYVRAAAARECGADGQPLPPERRLVVFPGLELTLSLPCQCIVLFDAELPIEHLAQLPGVLGFEPAPPTEQRSRDTIHLTQVKEPNDVIKRLDALSYLKDRFIVLPHVQENGHKTIIRAGFCGHYKDFLGVGGYVDGEIPPVGKGARKILDGEDDAYGNKALAVFQTSDSRSADFSSLGKYSSWVKWSKPTAEALRQSCLARSSRLVQQQPELPGIALHRAEVSISVFLGQVNLFLNPQYNAFIGGRGTGKSTLLEYLRWALCVPIGLTATNELPDYERRNQALLESTLQSVKGQIRVWASINGVEHVIERRTGQQPNLMLKIGASDFRAATEDEVQRLLPIEAYSQKQLSSIGGSKNEVLKFLLAPVSRDVKQIEDELRGAGDVLRATFAQVQSAISCRREHALVVNERESLIKQRETRKADLKGLSDADAKILREGEKYAEESKLVQEWRARVTAIKTQMDALAGTLGELRAPTEDMPDVALLSSAHQDLQQVIGSLASKTAALDADVTKVSSSLAALEGAHSNLLEESRTRYREALGRSKGQQAAVQEIERLSKTISDRDTRLKVLDGQLAQLRKPEEDFEDARKKWRAIMKRRGDLTRERCRQVEVDSAGEVRGTFQPCADARASLDLLRDVAKGARLQGAKLDALAATIAAAPDALDEWERCMDEVRSLIGAKSEDISLPHCPSLRAAGLNDKELRGLAGKIDDETWLRLRLAAPADVVEFEYKTREGTYIAFNAASAGQRATSLIRLLLAQAGGPLLIDQPEDDLDNRVIHEIAESLGSAKRRRQLVFASHNANLVVNGDADLICVFDYKVAGEQTAGEISKQGAIDDPALREAVTSVMEGGREAFLLRQAKYGY